MCPPSLFQAHSHHLQPVNNQNQSHLDLEHGVYYRHNRAPEIFTAIAAIALPGADRRTQSPMNAVLFADDDIVVVDGELLQTLRDMAKAAPLKRSRYCLHRSSEDPIQEMVIAFARGSYVRPHRHNGKSESFHILEGLLQVILLDDDGRVMRRIPLGPPGSGRPSVYRISCNAWHYVLIESESVIFHETTNGPFIPGQTEFATWAPDGTDNVAVADFVERLQQELDESSSLGGSASSAAVQTLEHHINVPLTSPGDRKSPTLTALICNFNHGRFISRAIEAMLTQSRPPDEFLVVDDGSTDDSADIIRSWVARYPAIRFLQNERNLGFHASFQRAITEATCDFVYSGAADDRILPGFFEGAMKLASQHPETGIVCGQMISVEPSGRRGVVHGIRAVEEPAYLDPGQYLRDVLYVEPATHSLSGATIFRRQPLIEVGGCRVELGSWGDTFSIQALGLKYGICYWPHPAMEWTILPGSISDRTRSDPCRALQILDRAQALMSSDQFKTTFPPDYVKHWAAGFRQAIVHEQLSSLIEGNQEIQSECSAVARTANPLTRLVIQTLQFAMRALYFVMFRVLRSVVSSQLDRRSL